MTRRILDTNVILRYLLADNPPLFAKAKEIFTQAGEGTMKLFLDEVVLAETIWTLTKPHNQPREAIYEKINTLVTQDWIINPRKKIFQKALEIYRQTNLSYIDCWLYIVSQDLNLKIETFDHKLRKLKL